MKTKFSLGYLAILALVVSCAPSFDVDSIPDDQFLVPLVKASSVLAIEASVELTPCPVPVKVSVFDVEFDSILRGLRLAGNEGVVILHDLDSLDKEVRLLAFASRLSEPSCSAQTAEFAGHTMLQVQFPQLKKYLERLQQHEDYLFEKIRRMVRNNKDAIIVLPDVETFREVSKLIAIFKEEKGVGIITTSGSLSNQGSNLDSDTVKSLIKTQPLSVHEVALLLTSHFELRGADNFEENALKMLKVSRAFLPSFRTLSHYFSLADEWIVLGEKPLTIDSLLLLISKRSGFSVAALKERIDFINLFDMDLDDIETLVSTSEDIFKDIVTFKNKVLTLLRGPTVGWVEIRAGDDAAFTGRPDGTGVVDLWNEHVFIVPGPDLEPIADRRVGKLFKITIAGFALDVTLLAKP